MIQRVAPMLLSDPAPEPTAPASVASAPASSVAPAKHPFDLRAEDALRAIGRDYAAALRASKADWKWATCHDESIGFAVAQKCLADAIGEVELEEARLGAPAAKDPCAVEIETKSRAYVRATGEHLRSVARWLNANGGRLAAPMTAQSLARACEVVSCAGYPVGGLGEASLGPVNTIDCTAKLFNCAPPSGNACTLAKIGERLGLGSNKAMDTVRLRGGSGRRVERADYEQPSGVTIDPRSL